MILSAPPIMASLLIPPMFSGVVKGPCTLVDQGGARLAMFTGQST